MLPVLEVLARAAARMPALRSACLVAYNVVDAVIGMDLKVWWMGYAAPGTVANCKFFGHLTFREDPTTDLSHPRVYFRVGNWRPTERVLDLLRRVGREKGQKDTVIEWVY